MKIDIPIVIIDPKVEDEIKQALPFVKIQREANVILVKHPLEEVLILLKNRYKNCILPELEYAYVSEIKSTADCVKMKQKNVIIDISSINETGRDSLINSLCYTINTIKVR